jgi:type VI protein secretion system component Hcp
MVLQHQGRLLDAAGAPQDGFFDITYRVFDASSGGVLLWEEFHSGVLVTDGLFDVLLGTVNPLSPEVLSGPTASASDPPRYLEMLVGTDVPLAPRVQLASTPYAVSAHRLHGDLETSQGELRLADGSEQHTLQLRADDLGSSHYQVDSFFDITYRIEFGSADTGAVSVLSASSSSSLETVKRADKATPKLFQSTCSYESPDRVVTLDRAAGDLGSHDYHIDSFFDITYRIDASTSDTGVVLSQSATDGSTGESSAHTSKATPKLFEAARRLSDGTTERSMTTRLDSAGTGRYTVDSFFDITYRIDESTSDTGVVSVLSASSSSSSETVKRVNKATPKLFEAACSHSDGSSSSAVRLRVDSAGSRLALERAEPGVTVPIEIVSLSLVSAEPLITIRARDAALTDPPAVTYEYDAADRLVREVHRAQPLTPLRGDSTEQTHSGLHVHDGPIDLRFDVDGLDFYNAATLSSSARLTTAGSLTLQGAASLALDPTAHVAVGSAVAPEKLFVDGNICATGFIGPCSDARYKKNVEPIADAGQILALLRGVRFDWRRDEFPDKHFADRRQLGLIAQEVMEVAPEVVSRGTDGYYSVDYSRLVPVLIEALKAQETTISDQGDRLVTLQERLAKLEGLVAHLAAAAPPKEEEALARR